MAARNNPGIEENIYITTQSSQFNNEQARLETFNNWNVSFIDKRKLALLGFYYIGPNDMVRCYFCGVEIGAWEESDDVLNDHKRWSPNCNFINGNSTNNVPIDAELLDQTLPPHTDSEPVDDSMQYLNYFRSLEPRETDDVYMLQPRNFIRGGGYSTPLNTSPRLATQNSFENGRYKYPEHPEYAVEANRLKSFEDWPKAMKQKPQQLSDAGFFYTGKGDRVACFSCGGGLKDWEQSDDPWEQHGMWYEKCEYVKLVKGTQFINKLEEKKRQQLAKSEENELKSSREHLSCSNDTNKSVHNLAESSKDKVSSNADEFYEDDEKKGIHEKKICKICFNAQYDTTFYPCGHIIACAKCASSVTKCPCCRQPFTNVIKVYFS